jgi:hypothetical protein
MRRACLSNGKETSRKGNNGYEICDKHQYARPRSRWRCDIKVNLRGIASSYEMDVTGDQAFVFTTLKLRALEPEKLYLLHTTGLLSTYLVHIYERHVM